MAFTIHKAAGARVPDIVSDLAPSAALIATPALVVSGTLVTLGTDSLVTVAATTDGIAGIITSEYQGDAGSFTSRGSTITRTFPDGVVATEGLPFIPIHGQLLIEADVVADTVTVALGGAGDTLDIVAGGLLLTTTTNADFRILKVLELNTAGTHIARVAGVFTTQPSYFAS